MSREKYCKFCGRELDEGKCSCNAFLLSQNKEKKSKKEKIYIVCDTCKAKVENDSNYCTNCGLPIHVNGKIEKLQKELEGLNAPDVIEVYGIKENKKKQKSNYSIALIAMIALATFVFGVAIGLVIKPKIDNIIRKMAIRDSIAKEEITDTSTLVEEETKIDGPTVHEEILEPTEGTKKEKQVKEDTSSEKKEEEEEETSSKMQDDEKKESEKEDDEKIETAEGKEARENPSDKKNLIDKTTKIDRESITIKRETETSIPETTSIIDVDISGKIKGVSDEDKKNAELYIQSLRSVRDTVTRNGEKCEISYFAPVFAGKDAEEIRIVNAAYTYAFDQDFHEILQKLATSSSELPLSIVFTEVEQKNITKNRLFIVTHGKVTPRSGLTVRIRYRALYDRREHTIKFEKIVE